MIGTRPTPAARARRRYDSPVRRERAAETRDRIVTAGSELVHTLPSWDWRELTVRAVAAQAGVNERTVYRHFATERELRAAILRRLEEEAGVSIENLQLHDFAGVTARVVSYLSTLAVKPHQVDEPVFADLDERRRDALLDAVAPLTADWPDRDRLLAASMLDVFWNVSSYERLVTAWNLDEHEVTRAITWVIGLIEEAIRAGRAPAPAPSGDHDGK